MAETIARKKDIRHDLYQTLAKDTSLITVRSPLPVSYAAVSNKRLSEEANVIVQSKEIFKEKVYNQSQHTMRWRLDDEGKFETPPAALTIGDVLDRLPKKKVGKICFESKERACQEQQGVPWCMARGQGLCQEGWGSQGVLSGQQGQAAV